MKTKTTIDSFKVSSGRVAVSDPCYDCASVDVQAKNGDWVGYAETSDEGSWGKRVSKILVHHHSFSPVGGRYDVEEHLISVDSGQAGVFDGGSYSGGDDEGWYDRSCKVTLSKVGFGYTNDGFVSSSGYGDGAYDCIVYKKDGKAIAVEVTFIDHSNKDEDMPDMEPSDDPWEGEYSWDTE